MVPEIFKNWLGNVILTDEVIFRCSKKSKTMDKKGNAQKLLNKNEKSMHGVQFQKMEEVKVKLFLK